MNQPRARLHLLFCLFVFESLGTRGQATLGLELGESKTSLLTNSQNEAQLQYHDRTGFAMAIPLTYELSRHFSVLLQPAWIQKSYKTTNNTDGSLYEVVTNNFLQLTAAARYTLYFKKWSATLEAGGFSGYWLTGHLSGNVIQELGFPLVNTFSGNSTFSTVRDERWEEGWELGGALERKIGENLSVFLQYCFYQALSDQQKEYMQGLVPRYNRTQVLFLGVHRSFRLSNKKKH